MQEKRLLSSLWVHCGGLGPLIAAYDEFSKGTGLEQRFVLESHFSIFFANLGNLMEASVAQTCRASNVLSMN